MQLARLSKFFLERKRDRKKDGRRGKYELGWEIKKKEKNEGEKVLVHRGNGIIIVTDVVKGGTKAEEKQNGVFVSEVLTFEERT